MIGTGPFILDKFVSLQAARMLRNPDWFAKDDLAAEGLGDRPILDGMESTWIPADDTTIEIAFRSKQVDDTTYVNKTTPDRVAQETDALLDEWISCSWVTSRLLINDSPAAKSPFKDLRLRKALDIGLDRSRMGQGIFQGSFHLATPVSQALIGWGLPLEELSKRPGYRFKREEREQDLTDARQLWEAAGGPDIGSVEIVYPGIPDFVKAYYPQFERSLKEALDLDAKGHLDATGYTEVTQGWLQKRLPFTFGYDNGWMEADDYLYPYFPGRPEIRSACRIVGRHGAQRGVRPRAPDQARPRYRYLMDKCYARLDWVATVPTAAASGLRDQDYALVPASPLQKPTCGSTARPTVGRPT
jgi:ABC-type transport system substrate-binding protein